MKVEEEEEADVRRYRTVVKSHLLEREKKGAGLF